MLELSPIQVHARITSILDRTIPTQELNQFICLCQSLSKVSLIHEIQHARLDLPQSLINQDQLDGFAMDCIADLFARDAEDDLFLLRRYFEPYQQNHSLGPKLALPLLRALVQSRVHQSLISLFSKVDQGGCKIWRNLNLVPKRNPQIKTFSYLSRTYFYLSTGPQLHGPPNGLNPCGGSLPDELLKLWVNEALSEHYGLPKVMESILLRLNSHEEYQHFISRSKLYGIFKSQLNIAYLDLEDYAEQTQGTQRDPEAEALAKNIQPMLIHHLEQQITRKYLEKSKIDEPMAQQYCAILEHYFCDLLDDGYVEKLSQYLELTDSEQLKNGQWQMHRGHLEYLIKLGKEYLKDAMEDHGFLKSRKMRVIR